MAANHTVRIIPHERSISAAEDVSVLAAAQLAGLPLPHSCRSGRCGSCRARLLSGRIEYPDGPPPGLSAAERTEGFVLLCQALARSDLVVEARLIQSAASVEIKTLPGRIARRLQLAPSVLRVDLRIPSIESMEFAAGQYLDVLLEGGLRRSYSVANAPDAGSQLELHVQHVPGGVFSEALFSSLREGAVLKIEGPFGRFRYYPSAAPALFIAGSTGFAPLKAMLGEALKPDSPPRDLHLYWGARDATGIYEESLVREWAHRHPRFKVYTVLSHLDPAAAALGQQRSGWVHEAVLEDHPDLAPFDIYAAGPPGMIEAIQRTFPARGARAEALYLDSFDYATDP
jgi:CDP-4-dehydro-6-deoxyglucose reductase, E3